MNITTIGVDLAKSVFQVHGVDERGKALLRKALKRSDVMNFFAKLLPCLVGMEACGSAHFWARKLTQLGHTVKLFSVSSLGFPSHTDGFSNRERTHPRRLEALPAYFVCGIARDTLVI
jgi:hypothetical protein